MMTSDELRSPPVDLSEYMTTSEVAETAFLSESHVRRLARDGEIPSVRYGARTRLFKRADVERWIRERLTDG